MSDFFRKLYAQIRPQISVTRVVAGLTPFLALCAGWVATKAAQWGYNPDPTQLTVVFVAGATAVVAAALKWLDGRAKWELQNPESAGVPPGPYLGEVAEGEEYREPDDDFPKGIQADDDFIDSFPEDDDADSDDLGPRASMTSDPTKLPDRDL